MWTLPLATMLLMGACNSEPRSMLPAAATLQHPAAVEARELALQTQPSDSPLAWRAGTAGSGSVTILATYRHNGRWCRLIEEARIEPMPQIRERSIWCRDASGAWRLAAAG